MKLIQTSSVLETHSLKHPSVTKRDVIFKFSCQPSHEPRQFSNSYMFEKVNKYYEKDTLQLMKSKLNPLLCSCKLQIVVTAK